MKTVRDKWINLFEEGLKDASALKIISPYITTNIVDEILTFFKGTEINVITRFNLEDFQTGVSSLTALETLLDKGAVIQGIKDLHSKVYLFDNISALITSANLTSKAFYNNYEFGVITKDNTIVNDSVQYFNWLHSIGGAYLNSNNIQEWRGIIAAHPLQETESKLLDFGANPNKGNEEKRFFIKFLGTSDDRVSKKFLTIEEISRAHCHYALCFSKRPRRYQDGDVVFIARLIHGDYSVFGKAEALRHVDRRDVASEEELEILDWKEKWPIYIRVKNAEFIDGTMGNCPLMNDLIEALEYECFDTTLKRYENGERNIRVKNSLKQQPDIQLSAIGARWLEEQFRRKLHQFGKVSSEFIGSLDQGSVWTP